MPTPHYLLNKYQRTLGSKTALLLKRLAIEGDISAKKYAADQKRLTARIGIAGTVGTGLAEYSTAKKGGYEGGILDYLGEKSKEHYGLDDGTTTTTTSGGQTTTRTSSGGTGDPKTDYRVAWKRGSEGRKEAAEDWWKNVKGMVPQGIGEKLKSTFGIGQSVGHAKNPFLASKAQQSSYSNTAGYSGEYGEHYEPEPSTKPKIQQNSGNRGIASLKLKETLSNLFTGKPQNPFLKTADEQRALQKQYGIKTMEDLFKKTTGGYW